MEENEPKFFIYLENEKSLKIFTKLLCCYYIKTSKPITREKYSDMMNLVLYIPPTYHEYLPC